MTRPLVHRENVRLPLPLLAVLVGLPLGTLALLWFMVWVIAQAACVAGGRV